MTVWFNNDNFTQVLRGSPTKMEARFGGSFRYANGKVNYFPGNGWQFRPDMSQVEGVEKKYWKMEPFVRQIPVWEDVEGVGWVVTLEDVDTGRPVEMTQAEKDAVDQAEKDARNAAIRAILDDNNEVVRALALTLLDVVNGDIPGSPPYTEVQLLNYMANKIAEA